MKRLVIGGPEKYDDTFVDWPDTRYSYNVHVSVSDSNTSQIFETDEIPSTDPFTPNIHTYNLQRINLGTGMTSVWLSNKVSTNTPLESKYWYNLFGCTDRWQRFYDQNQMKYIYQYYCFGKWHTYWSPTNEYLYRFAGQREAYFIVLAKWLLDARREMRFYKVERIDQTPKIGSSSS
jgi:hypothetical protein